MTKIDIPDALRRFGSAILRRSFAILRDHAAAEDAAQEVMVALATKGTQFRGGEAELAAWIYRLTTNTCLNHLRTARRRLAREESRAVASWIEVAPATPFEQLASRRELEALLERLDDLGRAVFVHLHVDGLTQEEIAQVTGVTRRTIGKRVKRIEQLLAGEEEVTP